MNKPDVKKDGLLPFVINRLKLSQKQIEAFGHQIKFAVARGPLNIPTLEGILLLDDIIGFIGDQQCKEYVVPYFKKIYGSFNAKVNFLHNDAKGLVCAPYLLEMGVNLFNFSFEHSIAEMKKLTSGKVTLLGNIPPRDLLEQGTPKDVEDALIKSVENLKETTRIILSCGGGVPQGVTTENINSFIATAKKL
jgi:uroporphyrinogen-III decarboxylase